ncbi:MAG: threonine transporter RhtB [Desulfuromonadales bacterium C00003068]|jgi:threonine/homoserine/homoserine lactone efflux protein|nr:MAG: threonine transporter RhtB [Desulfuromonadales bacterium C00003068]
MLPLDTLLAFAMASLLLALAPGPDNIFVLTQSALHGKGAGMMVTLGLCTGLIAHTLAVALGVAVLFQTSALAFTILKLVGAAYLIYLAWLALRAGSLTIASKSEGKQQVISLAKLYRRGIIMNITNPKVSIFFLAFLPQFTQPKYGAIAGQMVALGAIFMVVALIVFFIIAVLASKLGGWLNRSQRVQRTMNRMAAGVFLGLAIKLALTER